MRDRKKDISIHDFLDTFFKAKRFDALKKYFTKYIEGYDAANPTSRGSCLMYPFCFEIVESKNKINIPISQALAGEGFIF